MASTKTMRMKTVLFIFLMSIATMSCVIKRPPYKPAPGGMLPLAGYEQEVIHLVSEQPCDSTVKLYATNEYSIDSLLRLSEKRYAVFYLGMYYCQEQFFHRIAGYVRLHNDYFDFFPMFNYGSGPGYTYDFMRWEQYYRPVFIPDTAIYEKNVFDAAAEIVPTIDRICPECDHGDKMGASSFIVFERGKYLFHTDYTMDDFTCIEMLERLPLE